MHAAVGLVKTVGILAAAWLLGVADASKSSDYLNWLIGGTIIAGVLVYAFGQMRDFRPNKRLREDLSDLRRDFDQAIAERDELKAKVGSLEKSRDFDSALSVMRADLAKARAETEAENRAIFDEMRRLLLRTTNPQEEP
jgi:uncharacterized membrane protein YccC